MDVIKGLWAVEMDNYLFFVLLVDILVGIICELLHVLFMYAPMSEQV